MKTLLQCVVLCGIIVFVSSCAQKEKETPNVLQVKQKKQNDFAESKYNHYLLLMSNEQRAQFFKLESDLQRDRFLQAEGVKHKKYLNDHLKKGMTVSQAREIITERPLNTERNMNMLTQDVETRLIYQKFNGYNNMKYALTFKNDKLTDWALWLY